MRKVSACAPQPVGGSKYSLAEARYSSPGARGHRRWWSPARRCPAHARPDTDPRLTRTERPKTISPRGAARQRRWRCRCLAVVVVLFRLLVHFGRNDLFHMTPLSRLFLLLDLLVANHRTGGKRSLPGFWGFVLGDVGLGFSVSRGNCEPNSFPQAPSSRRRWRIVRRRLGPIVFVNLQRRIPSPRRGRCHPLCLQIPLFSQHLFRFFEVCTHRPQPSLCLLYRLVHLLLDCCQTAQRLLFPKRRLLLCCVPAVGKLQTRVHEWVFDAGLLQTLRSAGPRARGARPRARCARPRRARTCGARGGGAIARHTPRVRKVEGLDVFQCHEVVVRDVLQAWQRFHRLLVDVL
mmetsp:Transcript_57581/g.160358  ORF Transcript_57581/g.160358 Transcript_57581/m.160358 type:complete len:348 (+) Transcript_57581:267-1310(+)